MTYGSQIVGTGSALPERVMKNVEFESFIETSDEWIRTRTGIQERRISDPKKGEHTLSLSLKAAQTALQRADMKASDVELIIVGTVTPDTLMPTTANQLQAALGATKAFSFDLQAACSGFVYGLSIADQYIKTGMIKSALVIGAETLSSLVDWSDRSTCVLFGDAAGAVVLRRSEDPNHRILLTKAHSDGSWGELLCIPHGFARVPISSPEFRFNMAKIKMKGSEIFKLAVRSMVDVCKEMFDESKLSAADVDLFLFHQANMRIIDMCAKTMNVPAEKMWNNVDKYGNTSSATLPICLDEAWRAGKVKPGNTVLMATFGGGLTWAGALIKL